MEQAKDKEDNRAKYPEIAKLVDEVRKHFPDARVISINPIKEKPPEKKVGTTANKTPCILSSNLTHSNGVRAWHLKTVKKVGIGPF